MKLKKLIERVSEFLDADTKTQMDEIKSLRRILKELKHKERQLAAKLQKLPDQDEEREELQIKLDVIYAQRKKGLERAKEIKAKLQEKKPEPPQN